MSRRIAGAEGADKFVLLFQCSSAGALPSPEDRPTAKGIPPSQTLNVNANTLQGRGDVRGNPLRLGPRKEIAWMG